MLKKTTSTGINDEELSQIESKLYQIAQLKSLIAWLREAIKAKDRLIKKANNISTEEIAATLNIEIPEKPKMDDIPTEDDVIATFNIKQRNRIYYLNTLCAEIGEYIHPDGRLSMERKQLQTYISAPYIVRGKGRDAMLYTYTPTVDINSVNAIYFTLQQNYREYQAELNSFKHQIETTIQEATRKANTKFNVELLEYNDKMQEIYAKAKSYKDEAIASAQSLKIIIPDSLKPIFDIVSKTGK